MKVIPHQNEPVKLEPPFLPILAQHMQKEPGHPVCLKHTAASPGGRTDEEGSDLLRRNLLRRG
jgi:hypothetical protein